MEVEVNKTRSMQLQFSVAASFKNLGTLGQMVLMDFFEGKFGKKWLGGPRFDY